MTEKLDKRYLKKLNHYWDKMEKFFIRNISQLDKNEWFDMYHIHTDWYGKGSKNSINRKNSILLAYKCLKHTEDFANKYKKPIQTWLFIHENSYEDAVYIHTKNKNKSQYPYSFEKVNTHWNITDNPYLNEIVDTNIHKIGKIMNQYGTIYVIKKR